MSTYVITPAKYRAAWAGTALCFAAQMTGIASLFLHADPLHRGFAVMAIVCPAISVRYISRRWLAPYRAGTKLRRGQA